MKDILYSLLGSVEGNSKETLFDPVDKVDEIIHDAISTHGDERGGAQKVIQFIEVYVPYFEQRNDPKSLERIKLSIDKLKRTMSMFS